VDSLQLPRPTFADEQERSLNYQKEHPHPGPSRSGAQAQEYGGTKWNLRGFFTYWEAGDKVTLASSIPTEKFSGVQENWARGCVLMNSTKKSSTAPYL
jgi:hypothetical protein